MSSDASLLAVAQGTYLFKLLGFILLSPFQEVEQYDVTKDCALGPVDKRYAERDQ